MHLEQTLSWREPPSAWTVPLLGLINRCLSNKEIARELGIEVATVKNHVHNLFEKLSVHRRSQAAAKFRGEGQVPSLGQLAHPSKA